MNYKSLPEGYILLRSINPQKDRRLAHLVNGLSLAIAVGMVAAALPFVPFSTFLSIHAPSLFDVLRPLLLLPALLLYSAAHELIRRHYLKRYGKMKPNTVKGRFFCMGSNACFDRRSYLIISLAPVILLGALLMILNFALPVSCFWFVYFVQVLNLSGAAGDFYVSVYLSHLPRTVLTRDCGASTEIYVLAAKAE